MKREVAAEEGELLLTLVKLAQCRGTYSQSKCTVLYNLAKSIYAILPEGQNLGDIFILTECTLFYGNIGTAVYTCTCAWGRGGGVLFFVLADYGLYVEKPFLFGV